MTKRDASPPTLPFSPLDARFRLVTRAGIRHRSHAGGRLLTIEPSVLTELAAQAFHDASFFLRSRHLDQWAEVVADPHAHPNEKYVVAGLIRNAIIAAEGLLPLCQDTGTATIVAKRGELVRTGGEDEKWLSQGIARAFHENYLRYSQVTARTMFSEGNTGTNLPAQIDIGFTSGSDYHFLFIAKGGGSANKTCLFQESQALLTDAAFEAFLTTHLAELGVAACPPYHLAVVVGGSSPEMNLKMLKLATAGALDHLPEQGGPSSRDAFRDHAWEKKVVQIAANLGIGAQFGGRYLALDARVIRLPRHAASCPVSIGVSCSAHRNILGFINEEGAFLEQLDTNPSRLLNALSAIPPMFPVRVDLGQPMADIREHLSRLAVGTLVLLSGPMLVARDMAHARLFALLQAGKPLPRYFHQHPVYYAGPAKSPPNMPIGSLGPTTAQRLDGYLDLFMSKGASLVTLAKGNRTKAAVQACQTYGGFYLGTIGGAAALLTQEHITSCEILDFPDLGMEAIYRITVQDFPAFIVIDHRGKQLYAG
jgi:fumarate hydratase class I